MLFPPNKNTALHGYPEGQLPRMDGALDDHGWDLIGRVVLGFSHRHSWGEGNGGSAGVIHFGRFGQHWALSLSSRPSNRCLGE